MTEYTLAQVIDKFERNHNLKFKYIGENYTTDKGFVVVLDECGCLVDEAGELMLSNFSIGSKFMLANEPVSFKEAIKAYLEEKTIYCEFEEEKLKYEPLKDDISHPLWDQNENTITAEEILHGKWFIEEGENV